MVERIMVNDREFSVIRLLGKGKGGYSWLVTDGNREFVVKQIHHEPCDYYQFGDKMASELNDYQHLFNIGIPMPQLLDADLQREHILKEYIPGETVYTLVKEERMEDGFFRQIENMCRLLYPANANIDYFPTNFVVKDGMLYYVDYECNSYMQQWDFEHWGIQYWRKTPVFLEYEAAHR